MAKENQSVRPRTEPYTKLGINISTKHHEMFVAEAEMRKWSYRIMMEHVLAERYFSDEDDQ